MRNYLRLLRYALRQRRVFTLIFALTVVAAGLGALQPWPMKLLMDRLQEAGQQLQTSSLAPGGHALNPVSHCDIAWAGALATHAHLENRCEEAWALVC